MSDDNRATISRNTPPGSGTPTPRTPGVGSRLLGATGSLARLAAPFAVAAGADLLLNDGRITSRLMDGDRAAHEAGRLTDSLAQTGTNVINGTAPVVGGAARVISDIFTSQAGNPWMQGAAALGAAVIASAVGKRFMTQLLPGSGFAQGTGRLIGNVALMGVAAFAAATAVGMFRDDPNYTATHNDRPPVLEDSELNGPARPVTDITMAPPG